MNSPSNAIQISRPQASDEEHREKLQRLTPCKGKLSPEDAALLREVFRDIVNAHWKAVWSYLRSWGLPGEDVEDLLQETFISFHERVLNVGFVDNVDAFLLCVAERKVLNYLRGERRAPISFRAPSSSSEVPLSGLDIDRALDAHGVVRQIMTKLSPEHREVIEALVMNGLSYRDAAEVLNIPEGTLRSRFMAAKRALAEHANKILPPSQRGPR